VPFLAVSEMRINEKYSKKFLSTFFSIFLKCALFLFDILNLSEEYFVLPLQGCEIIIKLHSLFAFLFYFMLWSYVVSYVRLLDASGPNPDPAVHTILLKKLKN